MQKISIPLIAGLASGFAFANIVLALTWFLCRRSNLRKAQRRKQEMAAESSMERSVSFFKKNTEVPAAPVDIEAPETPEPEDVDDEDELTHSEKPDRYTRPPVRRQSEKALMPPPGLTLPPRSQLTVPTSFKAPRTSRDSVCETESMYSTASAPIHLHEQILLSPSPIQSTNNRLITPPRPVGRYPFRAPEPAMSLPSPIRPLLMASPNSEAFSDEDQSPAPNHHRRPRERLSQVLPWIPSSRDSVSSSRPTSEWYYTPKESSGTLPPHMRPSVIEPLRIAKSSPIGRQPAYNHSSMRAAAPSA